MKNLIWVVVVAGVAVAAYVLFGQGEKENMTDAAPAEAIEAPAEVVEEASEVEETVADAVKELKENAESVVKDVEEKAEDAMDAVKEEAEAAVSDVMEKAEDAVSDAVESATGATDAAEAVTETVTEAVTEEVTEAVTEDVDTSALDLLSPENFSIDKVSDLIGGSDLDVLKKAALTKAVEAAQNNPELLQAALDQVKEALGL